MDKEILIRFLRCDLSEREESRVLDWLDEDSANRDEFNELDRLFNAAILHAPAAVKSRAKSQIIPLKRVLRYVAGVAAVFAAIFIGGDYYLSRQIDELSSQTLSITTPIGERVSVMLQDGTQVWLNGGTTLSYPGVFTSKKRVVKVEGEAVFEVEHDAQRPFIVETYACDIEVLGTVFSVEAQRADKLFKTSLIEGSVQVSSKFEASDKFILKPMQYVEFGSDNRLNIGQMHNSNDLLWTDGIISLDESYFEELVPKLERAYGVEVVLMQDDKLPINSRGKVRINEGIEHVLNILKEDSNFSYKRDVKRNTVYIYAN